MPLPKSFWLDETLIAWTIQGGFGQIFRNAFVSLQSIAFCMVEWVAARAGAVSEIGLRLPSLAAAVASLYVYYRIGVEILDRETGLFLAALYVTLPGVAVEVPNARPYSLALLLEAAALLWLLRWLRSGRLSEGLLWAACAAGAGHLHHLFVIAYPVEVAFSLWRIFKGSKAKYWQLVLCCVINAVLLLPAIPQASVMFSQRNLLSYARQPDFLNLLQALTPSYLIFAVALVAALGWASGDRPCWMRPKAGREAAALGALVLCVPCSAFFAVSWLTETRLFESRYLLLTTPGFVLLWGWLLRGVEPASVRRISLIATLAIMAIRIGGISVVPSYPGEDWRSAVRSMPNSGGVLVYSGLVESRRIDWLQSAERRGYLAAPLIVYRPDISPSESFVLPFNHGDSEQAYVEGLLAGPLRERERITVVVRAAFSGPVWLSWLSQRLTSTGFRRMREEEFSAVQVAVFVRDGG
jgi:hypothetical protein